MLPSKAACSSFHCAIPKNEEVANLSTMLYIRNNLSYRTTMSTYFLCFSSAQLRNTPRFLTVVLVALSLFSHTPMLDHSPTIELVKGAATALMYALAQLMQSRGPSLVKGSGHYSSMVESRRFATIKWKGVWLGEAIHVNLWESGGAL